ILEQLQMDTPVQDEFVYAGGPVLTDRGFVLHRPRGQWQSTLPITETISLTTSRDILASFTGPNAPQDKLVALGYAGWGAGQLEQEIADNYWLTCPASEEILFHTPHAQKFHAALASLGVDLHRLSPKAGHAGPPFRLWPLSAQRWDTFSGFGLRLMGNPGSYACTGVRFWVGADRGCGGAEPDRPRFATQAVARPGWYSRLGPGGATGGGVAT